MPTYLHNDMSIKACYLDVLYSYDNADMPTAPHNLLYIMDIAMPTCRHIPKYQVEVTYVKANTGTC